MEHFFVQDEATDAQSLHERDRTIFLQLQDEKGDERVSSPTTLIKAWIHRRTAQEFDSPERKSLGSIFSHVRRILNIVLLSIGVLVGLLAGLIFFSYSGTTPDQCVPLPSFFRFLPACPQRCFGLLITIAQILPRLEPPILLFLSISQDTQTTDLFFSKEVEPKN